MSCTCPGWYRHVTFLQYQWNIWTSLHYPPFMYCSYHFFVSFPFLLEPELTCQALCAHWHGQKEALGRFGSDASSSGGRLLDAWSEVATHTPVGLKIISKEWWKITIFHGKIHYKWPFSIADANLIATGCQSASFSSVRGIASLKRRLWATDRKAWMMHHSMKTQRRSWAKKCEWSRHGSVVGSSSEGPATDCRRKSDGVQRFFVLFVLLVTMQALENLGKYMPSKVMKLFTRALTLRFLQFQLWIQSSHRADRSSKVAGLFHYFQMGNWTRNIRNSVFPNKLQKPFGSMSMWLYFGLGLFDYEQLCQIFGGGLVEHMAMSCRQLIALY